MKRFDLQGIRGIAILAVLLFHYFGETFPNGYIGVDMFFVLSGYLMTMILGSSKSLDSASIQQFYYRRIKRIVPLFMFTIFGATLLVFLLFPPTFISINCDSAFTSMFLYRNLARHSDRNEYFKMLNQADDIFTHTWSLCVEMQFYVLAPLLLLVASKCHDYRILYASTVFIASLAYHLLADSDTSFNSVFCRIWQFVAGSFAFNISEYFKELDVNPKNEFLLLDQDDHDDDDLDIEQASPKLRGPSLPRLPFQTTLYISLMLLLILSFFPEELPSKILRIVCTLLTAVIITAGTLVDQNPLNNRHLVYFGDISYALYLVHWPLYVYLKCFYEDNILAYPCAICISIILAILISETFEKFYLNLGPSGIAILILPLYVLTIAMIFAQTPFRNTIDFFLHYNERLKIGKYLDGDIENLDFSNISQEDSQFLMDHWSRNEYPMLIAPHCQPNTTVHGFCEFEESRLNGNLTTFIVGNSYAANLADLIYKSAGNFSAAIQKFSASGCEVLTIHEKRCIRHYREYIKRVASAKPDVLFIIDRHFRLNQPITSPDLILKEARETLKIYKESVKSKIYLLDSICPPFKPILSKYSQLLKSGKIVKQEDFEKDPSCIYGHRRLRELLKDCGKCEIIDVNRAIGDRSFDDATKLGYFFDGGHLTPMVKKIILPVFKNISMIV
ncbi:unnamed protein product [Caenorhabditis bovis]|uniref:Acyltransferase n=1 Tax=Caenorhabditis bovis TaxID=2654633 RepID=A0A8S1F1W6_9PELO|nr:unnamed protein product [Caenorhabditis bovis]